MFYVADVVDGFIDNDAAKAIDAQALSKKELDKLLYILDSLL